MKKKNQKRNPKLEKKKQFNSKSGFENSTEKEIELEIHKRKNQNFFGDTFGLTNVESNAFILFPERLEKAIPIQTVVQYHCEHCPLVCRCTCHSRTRVTVSTEKLKGRTYYKTYTLIYM